MKTGQIEYDTDTHCSLQEIGKNRGLLKCTRPVNVRAYDDKVIIVQDPKETTRESVTASGAAGRDVNMSGFSWPRSTDKESAQVFKTSWKLAFKDGRRVGSIKTPKKNSRVACN